MRRFGQPSVPRGRFLAQSCLAVGTAAVATRLLAKRVRRSVVQDFVSPVDIGSSELRSGKIDNLDFAKVASDHGIQCD